MERCRDGGSEMRSQERGDKKRGQGMANKGKTKTV